MKLSKGNKEVANISKHIKPRFGSDWDLDLGWILFWLIFGIVFASVMGFFSWASVQNNRGNVERDRFYASNCKTVVVLDDSRVYDCKDK